MRYGSARNTVDGVLFISWQAGGTREKREDLDDDGLGRFVAGDGLDAVQAHHLCINHSATPLRQRHQSTLEKHLGYDLLHISAT